MDTEELLELFLAGTGITVGDVDELSIELHLAGKTLTIGSSGCFGGELYVEADGQP